jgi:general secretion pathway protein C
MVSSPSATPINRVGSRERLFVIDRATVEAAVADSEAVLDTVDIRPARLFNREVGFRITGFESNSIFSKMGLRNGDLLTSVNDQEIAGPQEAASLFETLREGGDIDLTVRRRARTYHINLLIQ